MAALICIMNTYTITGAPKFRLIIPQLFPSTSQRIRLYGNLSHLDSAGSARMVDVGSKPHTTRCAIASGRISLSAKAWETLASTRSSPKGSVLGVAQIAGIMAAKQTSNLIPLCHPLTLSHVWVDFDLVEEEQCVVVRAGVRCEGGTGVEMEALMSASVALLTIYDMTKSASHSHTITDVRLEAKEGGQSGMFRRQDNDA